MKKVLVLLRSTRTSRRDAALGRVAAARQALDDATAVLAQSQTLLQQALAWQLDVRQGRGRATDAAWRAAILPSCEALVAQRKDQLELAMDAVTLHQHALHVQRAALALYERALNRTDALQRITDEETRNDERLQEQALDDDLAAARRRGGTQVAR